MKKSDQSGFATIEAVLVFVIVAMIGGTGFFVWHTKQNTDKSMNDTANSQPGIYKGSKVTDFASCKAVAGSKILTTYPEQCVTKDGKKFVGPDTYSNTQKYLVIKEWGVKFPYTSSATLAYSFMNATTIADITSTSLVTFKGCEKTGAGGIARLTADDYFTDDMTVGQAYSQYPDVIGKVGNYYYYFHHSQAACADTITDASSAAQSAANDLVKTIVAHAVAE